MVPTSNHQHMVVFGGANICNAVYFNDVWSFDVGFFSHCLCAWLVRVNVLLLPIFSSWGHIFLLSFPLLLLAAPSPSTASLQEMYQWKQLNPKGVSPTPRWQSCAVTIEDRMFVYAGCYCVDVCQSCTEVCTYTTNVLVFASPL